MRRALALCALVGCTAFAAASAAAAPDVLQVTPIGRLPFPERGYLLGLPRDAAIGLSQVRVSENGIAVGTAAVEPLRSSRLRYGVVLALDASDSMKGAPFAAAIRSARSFLDHIVAGERVGLVTFNGDVRVLRRPTTDERRLAASLAHPPALAYGTRIYDALDRSLALLAHEKVSAGAVVLLSDGADVGSKAALASVVGKARAQHVRVFTVGLRSPVFDRTRLGTIARSTGGSFAEATSAAQLVPIYDELSRRLSGEYVLLYRSTAAPNSHVHVEIAVDGFGTTSSDYTAPTPSGFAPFHRSLLSRFVLSPASGVVLSLLVAALVWIVLRLLLQGRRPRMVERISAFVGDTHPRPQRESRERRATRAAAAGSRRARNWLAKLEQELDIAAMSVPATRVVGLTVAATASAVVLLALASPLLALLGLLVPLVPRAVIKQKVRSVRGEFADQLPPNLQVLASALRTGHSFGAALATSVENAHQPSRRELGRAVADEKLGMPIDDAIRRVAVRMANRDLEQVALLAELQRTTGGNAAEMLDVVVATVRERGDIRRLVKTLTAQGRMSRWILSGLPIVTGLAFYAIQPQLMGPMLHSGIGQAMLVIAALMVVAGSAVIQRIIDIEI